MEFDLNKMAEELKAKYGFDIPLIIGLLMKWGPFLADLILGLLSKRQSALKAAGVTAQHCDDRVLEHLDCIIEDTSCALAQALCLKCCLTDCK